MATFINATDTRFIRFLKRRHEVADQTAASAVRVDTIAARPEHERLRMGI